jgi:hemoglobin-like flavoprotein
MTPEQTDLIRTSFDSMWPMRSRLAELCYERLFELAPESRGMFPNDMEKQRLKLMDMISALVGALDRRDVFDSLIARSASQHAALGVTPSQYAAFGDALMWSFDRQFGAAFTPELREAWAALYAVVRNEMQRGRERRPGA